MKTLTLTLRRLLLLTAVFALAPQGVAAYDFMVDSICYRITSDTTVAVTRHDFTNGSHNRDYADFPSMANIPETVTWQDTVRIVTAIDNYALRRYTGNGLTSLTVPATVKTIGIYAFLGNVNLTAVTLNEGLEIIGNDAFDGCSRLMEITIPATVKEIGAYAFAQNVNLTAVTLNEGLEIIGNYAFEYCSRLKEIAIPNSVTTIYPRAFEHCTSLQTVTIGSGVASIGYGVFIACPALQRITVSSSNQHYCGKDGVLFSKDMTELLSYPAARSATTYSIPYQATTIDNYAFHSCNLEQLSIGAKVQNIDIQAFYYSSIESYVAHNGNPYFASSGGVLYNKDFTTLVKYPRYGTVTEFDILPTVTEIGPYAVYNNPYLSSVTLPDAVEKIAYAAFGYCSNLTHITMSNSLKEIQAYAFTSCRIRAIDIPDSVTSTGDYMLHYTSLLKDLRLGKSVGTIGDDLIRYCRNLQRVFSANPVPPTVDRDLAYDTDLSGCTLYVPKGTLEAYAADDKWAVFGAMEEYDDDTRLAVERGMRCQRGDTIAVPVILRNAGAVAGFQCNITVPGGFAVARDSNGNPIVTLNEERRTDHALLVNTLANGTLAVLGFSPTAEAFAGEDGTLFTVQLVAGQDINTGDYVLEISEIELTAPDGGNYPTPSLTMAVRVFDYLRGDANGDGKVSVADVIATANKAVGKTVEPFVHEAADVNSDGNITVADVIIIANLAVGRSAAPRRVAAPHDGGNTLSVDGMDLPAGMARGIDIDLSNPEPVSGIQMDIDLPHGVTLTGARLGGRADGFTLLTHEHEGITTLLAYSTTAALEGDSGTLLTLELTADGYSGDGALLLDNIRAALPDGTERILAPARANLTAATAVTEAAATATISIEGGNILIVSPSDGVAHMTDGQGITRTVAVKAGRNTIAPGMSGLIIVRFEDQTLKTVL